MPKIAVRTEDRVRIELEYDDYKEWERILGSHAEEHTTVVDEEDSPDGAAWWKTLYVKVGETEYRFSGPLMRSREE
jgi:hypothetical protein